MDAPLAPEAEQAAWSAAVQREERAAARIDGAQQTQQQAAQTATTDGASNTQLASPPPPAKFDASTWSLFPSTLHPSPHHHSPEYNILTLSAAPPSAVPPSPYLSESPSAPEVPLAHDHILNNPTLIVNVWASNMREELARIQALVDDYPYIAMDTEFPGIVARPAGTFKSSPDYAYQSLKCNVDLLKIIQLGLCFCDAQGNICPGTCTWQFNFSFSLSADMYAQDSIDLLSKSGIDFGLHEKNGIQASEFAEWLLTSGIVLNEDVKWITFHSGHDFGYLLKMLTAQPLPAQEEDFLALLQIYFPCVYDIKFLMDSCHNLHGGLSKVAELLGVRRIGPQHQAGSDSLLTAATFFKLKDQHFNAKHNDIWAETEAHRNAVRREMRLSHGGSGGASLQSYAVLTNTDRMSEFDTKFLGMLYGLNNDYTVASKKDTDRAKVERERKEAAIARGQTVSSDDDDEAMTEAQGSKPIASASSSPVFVPAHQSSSQYNVTPQKLGPSQHHSSYPSPHDYKHSASKQRSLAQNEANQAGGRGAFYQQQGHSSWDQR